MVISRATDPKPNLCDRRSELLKQELNSVLSAQKLSSAQGWAIAAKRAGVWNLPYMDGAPIGKRDDRRQPAM
jgi:hypothetical protein